MQLEFILDVVHYLWLIQLKQTKGRTELKKEHVMLK